MKNDLSSMSDAELVRSLKVLAREEREQLVLVLKHLNEMDKRRIAIEAGFPSLFEYSVRELRYAQGEAARRIQTARAAKRFPLIYRTLERGLLSLTTASMLAPHLTWTNYRRLIREASGRGKREVETMIAAMAPGQVPAERVRFVAVIAPPAAASRSLDDLFAARPAAPAEPATAGPSPAQNSPTAPEASDFPTMQPGPVRRVHFSFTADESFLRDVERARELLWHKSPAGKLEKVFAEALKALLKSIDPARRTPRAPESARDSSSPRNAGRRPIPRAVQTAVWRRDGGSCAFLAPDGRRCGSKAGLEFDHVLPWARGGASDEDNLRLLCRAHNQLAARRSFGNAAIDAAIAHHRSS